MATMSRTLKALVTKTSLKERYKTAQSYQKKLKFLVEDVSISYFLCIYIQQSIYAKSLSK